jgi:hypothetical protein
MSGSTGAQTLDGFRDSVGVPEALGEVAHDGVTAKVAASFAASGQFGAAKDHIMSYARSQYAADEDAGTIRRAGQQGGLVGTVLGITIAAVVAYVGLQVANKTRDAGGISGEGVDAGNQTAFQNSSESLTSGLESGMSLLEVVFIVLLLSLIVGALVGLRR